MFGEVAEDQCGAVGVLDGLAGRAVQGLVEDAGADDLRVGAVEVPELGPQRRARGVGEQLAGGDLSERMSADLGPEPAEGLVQRQAAVLP